MRRVLMNYKSFEYEKCSKCENEVILENASFCNICCYDLRNLCSNQECVNKNGASLPKNSRYCHLCGYKTTYLINNLLEYWEDNQDVNLDDTYSSENNIN